MKDVKDTMSEIVKSYIESGMTNANEVIKQLEKDHPLLFNYPLFDIQFKILFEIERKKKIVQDLHAEQS